MSYIFVSEEYGELLISNMFDIDGDETNDPSLAISIVAELPNGKWFASTCFENDIKYATSS